MVAVVEETKNHETKELRGARVRLRRFDALDDELGVALARWNASAAELVGLVRRIIDDDCSVDWGYLTPERVLTQRCGVDRATALRLVAVAREIGEYPETFRLFREGQLTLDHVGVIVHRLDPAYEALMAEAFCQVNIGQARRLALEYPKPVPEPAASDGDGEPEPGPGREPFPLPDPERGRTRDRIVARRHDDGRLRGSFDLGGEVADLFERTEGCPPKPSCPIGHSGSQRPDGPAEVVVEQPAEPDRSAPLLGRTAARRPPRSGMSGRRRCVGLRRRAAR